jgi:hypothetical protein
VLGSDFFNRCKNVRKAIKLQLWASQLMKRMFNFEISKFSLNWMVQQAVLRSLEKSRSDG